MRLLAGRSWDAWAALKQAMDLTRRRLERGKSPASHKPTASTTRVAITAQGIITLLPILTF